MKPDHVAILEVLDGQPYLGIHQMAWGVGMTTRKIRGLLRDLHYNGFLVTPKKAKGTGSFYIKNADSWKLTASGKRLVDAMKKYFNH
jgi:predicted transcriptional regulator